MKNICPNCNTRFKYKDIIKSTWSLKIKDLKCKKCLKEYKLSLCSILIISTLVNMPILIIYKIMLLIGGKATILLYIIWVSFIIAITPIFCNYKEVKNK
ncbi:TIGR04104 family putative zinc finger protein [Clostridium taeniosporum]|uniref:Cxxc_20_cxxc protein n=1 Tax=Clostridium taeniosporum TaxID=394958 RepID=A0A1D7XPF1_9CLOT|nr:TIGR04104 family putative zinc finger protein [Clostridium taeniosporum]AOR25080.1 hypothetical protein BGI42_15145 [Clostridium taeniosporum]